MNSWRHSKAGHTDSRFFIINRNHVFGDSCAKSFCDPAAQVVSFYACKNISPVYFIIEPHVGVGDGESGYGVQNAGCF